MVKVNLTIDGMACGMCEAHINDVIRANCKPSKLKSSFKKGTSEFLCEDDEVPSEETLRAAIDATGYKLTGYTAEPYVKKGFSLFGR